jgi:predicted NBD/HSP70 family sugar kinase
MTHQEPPQMLPAAADSCELPLQTRMDVRLMPDTAIAETRTIEVLWSTGAAVRRRDPWSGRVYEELLSLDPAHVDLSRLNGGAPLLNAHDAFDLEDRAQLLAEIGDRLGEIAAQLSADALGRVQGVGIAAPFSLGGWQTLLDMPPAVAARWPTVNLRAEVAARTDLPVSLIKDTAAACVAELVAGRGRSVQSFLYVFVDTFIGGGLVLNQRLFTGRTGNAAGVGPMPVQGPDGRMRRLLEVASLASLADEMEAAGESADHLWEQPDRWQVPEHLLERWLTEATEGLASAILSATTLLELEAVLIDGWMPISIRAEITARTTAALQRLDLSGITPPVVREGTVGAQARSLGAAAIPLSQRYLLDQNAAQRDA